MTKTSNGLKKTVKTIIKAADILAVVFLCLVLLFNLYMVISKLAFKNDMPKVFGYANAIIISPSMGDTIEVHDMIIIREREEYQIRDIITYRDWQDFVTHRLIEITEEGKYIAQGDANNTPDSPIDPSQVVGKVVFVIPKIGVVINFLRTPIGILILITVGAALVYLPGVIDKIKKKTPKDE